MNFIFCIAAITIVCMAPQNTYAQTTTKGASGLPIPRFVSLKAKRVNMRVGPGQNYTVSWLYTKAAIPMEIIQEFDNWRRVRDFEGTDLDLVVVCFCLRLVTAPNIIAAL